MERESKTASFFGEYKSGLLGKKNKIYLWLYETHIEGIGAEYYRGELEEYAFEIELDNIKRIYTDSIKGNKSLMLDVLNTSSVVQENHTLTIVFPNLQKQEEAMELISDGIGKYEKRKQEQIRSNQERKEQELSEKKEYDEASVRYYKDCYNFHIAEQKNPYYELQSGDMQFCGIYIDKDRNLNFLKIDGIHREESNGCIPYEMIHYYEKAGSVHYTSEIHGECTTFGGSISGATISATASVLGGLFLGPMGMAAGAMLTHQPSRVELPNRSFHISSGSHKIDDRSVILNYYSDTRQQLIDIELPAGIYNFLQTHLPEKKYGIVLELEKRKAIREQEQWENTGICKEAYPAIGQNEDMRTFENRIKKLKILYDNGILSEEEFRNEKNRILSEL